MSFYHLSSQRKSWLINNSDYATLRLDAFNGENIKYSVRTLPETLSTPKQLKSTQLKRIEDEDVFITRYCKFIHDHFCERTEQEKIQNKKRAQGVPLHWRVAATAIVYFRRFYLNNSLYVFDPRIIMLTCVFLAGKTEECAVTLSDLLRLNSNDCTKEDICKHEITVIQGLNYQLRVYHTTNIVSTLIADFKRWCDTPVFNTYTDNDSTITIANSLSYGIDSGINEHKTMPSKRPLDSTTSNTDIITTIKMESMRENVSHVYKRIKIESSANNTSKDSEIDIIEHKDTINCSSSSSSSHVTEANKSISSSITNQTTIDMFSYLQDSSYNILTSIKNLGNTDMSLMRKTWKEKSEVMLLLIQYTACSFFYTPVEITLSVLIITLYDMLPTYDHIVPIFQYYLFHRYGKPIMTFIQNHLMDIQMYIDKCKKALEDQKTFQHIKDNLKSKNVWKQNSVSP